MALILATALVFLAGLSSFLTACGDSAGSSSGTSASSSASVPPGAYLPFAAASRLYKEGFDKEAEGQVVAVLSASPQATIPPSLSSLLDPPWYLRLWRWAWRNWLVVSACLVAVVFLVWYTIANRRKRLLVEEFKVADDKPVGAPIAALVQQYLAGLSGEEDESRLRVISTPPEKIELPTELGSVAPAAGLILAFSPLARSRLFKLSGSLHPAGDRGAGLTLLLRDAGGSVKNEVTLWQEDYDPAFTAASPKRRSEIANHYSLAPAAAAWVLCKWSEVDADQPRPLGGSSWESVAHFASALDASSNVQKKKLYQMALKADGQNRGALLNLAWLELETHDYQAADGHLNRLIELLVAADNAPCDGASEKRRRAENEADCVMWLRAQYSLAALIRNRSLCQECRLRGRCTEVFHYRPFARSPGATALRASARENAEELLLRASLVLGNLEGEHRGQLAALAAAVEPRAMALLAEIMDDRETVGTELSDAWRKRGWFLNPATSSEREELVRKLREHVLSRHDLVGWMESRDTGFQLAPKFEYGVACYEADCERYAAAFDHLEKAIKATPSLLDSARVDPSFCGFRRHSPPRRWQDLERLVP